MHPSLFPLIYARSKVLPCDETVPLDSCLDYICRGGIIPKQKLSDVVHKRPKHGQGDMSDYWSTNFQWLPCQVVFDDAQGVRITSYINNLHPRVYVKLYSTIEQVIVKCIPLWDKVLSLMNTNRQPRIPVDEGVEYHIPEMPDDYRSETDEDRYARLEHWERASRILIPPEPSEYSIGEPSSINKVDLRKKFSQQGLQVIIKLANIELTPERPEYEGGSWHVEGQMNEHICASALYYYESENITGSSLAFRQNVGDYDMDIEFKAPQVRLLFPIFQRDFVVFTWTSK